MDDSQFYVSRATMDREVNAVRAQLDEALRWGWECAILLRRARIQCRQETRDEINEWFTKPKPNGMFNPLRTRGNGDDAGPAGFDDVSKPGAMQ